MNFLPGGGRGLVGELVGDDPGLLRGVVHEGDGGALAVEVDDGEHAPGEAGGRYALGSKFNCSTENSFDFASAVRCEPLCINLLSIQQL